MFRYKDVKLHNDLTFHVTGFEWPRYHDPSLGNIYYLLTEYAFRTVIYLQFCKYAESKNDSF